MPALPIRLPRLPIRLPRRDRASRRARANRHVRRPGNVVLRRRRLQPEVLRAPQAKRFFRLRPTPRYLVAAFASVILLGGLLLSLPIASESRTWTNGLDALFTSASAVCVTGLVRVDTAEHWSGFGEVVILSLIQLGGLGVTMYAGILLLLFGRRFGLRSNAFFGMELSSTGDWDIRRLLRRVVIFVVVAESITFLLLLPWFLSEFDGGRAIWSAFFHAISSFNSAGFDLMGGLNGFTGAINAEYPITVMGSAAFLGSLSFVTVLDLRRGWRRFSLDTRFVLITMFGLLAAGMVIFLVTEAHSGHTLDGLGPGGALANAFFLAVNRTTGMTTVDIGTLQDVTAVLLLPLMFIGGASTSTAGGIKVGTFVVGLAVVWSILRGRHQVEIFAREIPHAVVLRAMGVILLGVAATMAGIAALEISETSAFLPLTFEAMSAIGNVGWSQGLTPVLSDAGAAIVIVLMFVGRLGPLLVALTVPDDGKARYHYAQEGVRIG